MGEGRVKGIFVAESAAGPVATVTEARAIAGVGIEGDRYARGAGTFSPIPGSGRQVTLIESETLEAVARDQRIAIEPARVRRNILTRGVPLNHLVGQEFRVGEAVLRGMRLCEPCKHIEELTVAGMLPALIHRGGLRAEVIAGGTIREGDTVLWGANYLASRG